jgi:hypothetical protein
VTKVVGSIPTQPTEVYMEIHPTVVAKIVCSKCEDEELFATTYSPESVKGECLECMLEEDMKPVKHCMKCYKKDGSMSEMKIVAIQIQKEIHDVKDTIITCDKHKN